MDLVQNEVYNKDSNFGPTNIDQLLTLPKFQFMAPKPKCNGTCHKTKSNAKGSTTNGPQGSQAHQKGSNANP